MDPRYQQLLDLSPEDLFRYAELSAENLQLVSDPGFVSIKSDKDFGSLGRTNNVDKYRAMAAKNFITRDSPLFMNINEALRKASVKNDQELIRRFINQGANDWKAGLLGASEGGHLELMKYFISGGANNLLDALVVAAENGKIEAVKFLLSKVTKDVNYYNIAMARAAMNGYIEVIRLLLNAGATDVNTAFLEAVSLGDAEIINLLIEHGADNICSAVILAASSGDPNIVKMLIDQCPNPEDIDYDEALNEAIKAKLPRVLKVLLEKGKGKINYKDAFTRAKDTKNKYIFEVLLEKGAKEAKETGNRDLMGLVEHLIEQYTRHRKMKIP